MQAFCPAKKKRHAGGVSKGKWKGSVYNEDSKKHFVDHNKIKQDERQ
jgi:hypothetical protein